MESNIRGSIQSLGNNVVYIQKWPWSFGPDYPWWKYINRPTPRYEELDELQKRCKTTEAIAYRLGARKLLNTGRIAYKMPWWPEFRTTFIK